MRLQVKRIADVDMISYTRANDAAFDLRSAEEGVLAPGDKKMFKTGLQMAIPEKHVGLVWDRSGLAAKQGIHVLAGVIDSEYRGELCVVLKNLGDKTVEITKNMRIAQMLIQPVVHVQIEEVEELGETARGEGGFGSSGNY